MRVVQVSTYDGGQGAARAAFRLHRALRDQGIDSSMRVAHASSGDAWVQAPRSKPRQAMALLRSTASWWLSKPQRSANPVTHSVAALPSGLDRELNAKGADLLHLHWLQDEFLSVEAVGRLRGPVVWTLHDTWPFCGSEHYPLGCAGSALCFGLQPWQSLGARSRVGSGSMDLAAQRKGLAIVVATAAVDRSVPLDG